MPACHRKARGKLRCIAARLPRFYAQGLRLSVDCATCFDEPAKICQPGFRRLKNWDHKIEGGLVQISVTIAKQDQRDPNTHNSHRNEIPGDRSLTDEDRLRSLFIKSFRQFHHGAALLHDVAG